MTKIFHVATNLLIIGGLLALPYYLFGGRLFLGGDDTRFYYAYPKDVLSSLAFYSWDNISSLPYYIPNHHLIPLLLVSSFFEQVFKSKTLLFYLSFSAVLILGFVYFQKLIRELIGDGEYAIATICSLIFILSPITQVSLMFFLAPVWLISLFPIVSYYFVSFIKRGKKIDLLKIFLWSILFSFAYYSIPWILAFLIPLVFGGIFFLLFIEKPGRIFIERALIFIYFTTVSQLFWIIPFLVSITSGGATGLGQKISSVSLADSFKTTILTTATDNIIYPLFTFYHRQLVFDFLWNLKNVFISYYDWVMPLGLIFVIILCIGISQYSAALQNTKKKVFIFFFSSFIVVLFLSTINIGFLKDLIIQLAPIPGIGILRNFVDKFALSFIFIYSALLALCLFAIKRNIYKLYFFLSPILVFVLTVNLVPIKQVIAGPLWKTKNIYTSVNFPQEYLSFVDGAKKAIPKDSNVFSIPQNITSYAIVTEPNGINAYVGTSPFKAFSGINDLSGEDSYPQIVSDKIKALIIKRDYKKLLDLLSDINVGYLMETKNIPSEVLSGYLFDKEYLALQDEKLVQSIVDHEVLRSARGNYILYRLKTNPSIFTSDAKVTFKRNSPVSYEIFLSGIKKNTHLVFHETYHPGWRLYVNNKSSFQNSHSQNGIYGNKWTINSSKPVHISLYFFPQVFFYFGIALTIISTSLGWTYITKKNEI